MTPRRWLVRAVDLVNRKGKSVGVRLVRYTGKSADFVHPKHLVATAWHDWYVEHLAHRTARAGGIANAHFFAWDVTGRFPFAAGVSLALCGRLSRWKREAALRHPGESTGFQVVARRAE